MGVAMVVAVDLASESARAAYLLSTETLGGRGTHHVLGASGSLPDSLFPRLRLAGLKDGAGRPAPMTPVVEARVAVVGPAGDSAGTFRLVGLDPFTSRELGAFGLRGDGGDGEAVSPGTGGQEALMALMARPATILLARDAAERLGLRAGGRMGIRSGNRIVNVTVIGFLEPPGRLARSLVEDLLLCDIATAQEILGREGRVDRIEMDLAGGGSKGRPDAALVERARALLPPGAHLAPANARAKTLDGITRAFRINLTALSLLALLVGAFLIHNTMAFSVAQRWGLLGALRGLGAEPGQVAAMVAREAAALSALGALLGVLGGVILGRGLVVLVARTVNDLYFTTRVAGLELDPLILLKGALLGLVLGMASSAAPAWQASRIRPRVLLTRSAQEASLRARLPTLNRLGLLLALAAALLAAWPGRSLLAGFAALASAVFAWALWTPDLLRRLSAAAAWTVARLPRAAAPGASAMLARMAVREVGGSLSRTAVAAAALTIALSVTVAMGVMVDSFRRAVADWLEAVLVADVYAAARDGSGRLEGRLDSAWLAAARALPGVEAATTYLAVSLNHPDGGRTRMLALDIDPLSRRAFRFRAGDSAAAWSAFHRAPDCAVLISEPLAWRRALRPGAALELPTARGPRAFPVAGVLADYGSDQGTAMLDRACFESYWEDRGHTSVALFAAPGTDPAALARRLASLPGAVGTEIHATRDLRTASLEIFDRTFAITSVLRLAAVVIALASLAGALAALELERAPETALLRALGLTPGGTFGLAAAQAGFLGAAAGLLAIPLGLVQAGLLVHVINRRSFGWTMPMHIDPWICAQAVLLGTGAALLASLLPAWKASRAITARALREE